MRIARLITLPLAYMKTKRVVSLREKKSVFFTKSEVPSKDLY